jgi:hypothetical protein
LRCRGSFVCNGGSPATNAALGIGVQGTTGGGSGKGVSGTGQYGMNDNNGVYGQSGHCSGVRGASGQGESDIGKGVDGRSNSGHAVDGFSTSGSAVYADGKLTAGEVDATTKNFRIDHPLDPANKVLVHSCVESNERKLVYDGLVTTDATGEATVLLPDWFGALNEDLRYQPTTFDDVRAWIKSKVRDNRFVIATSRPNAEVSWQVTGVRRDAYAKAHPLEVEQRKTGRENGRFLNPIEHGQPASKGVTHEDRQRPGPAAPAARA